MVDSFLLKLVLSFFVGGLYAIVATVIADTLGSKLGGLISALPSTVLFGLLFIAWTHSTKASVEATTLIPAVVGLTCPFLITYVSLVKRNVWIAVLTSFIVWSILVYFLIASHISSFFISLIIFAFFFGAAYIFFYTRTITSTQANTIVYSTNTLLVRGLISGSVVALSVAIAKIGGPVFGGICATFPAMFTSTFLITYFSHGHAFSVEMAKSAFFGLISTVIFVLVAHYTFLPLGILLGTLVSLFACYTSAYLLYNHTIKKHT